jgi:hypothetical protein
LCDEDVFSDALKAIKVGPNLFLEYNTHLSTGMWCDGWAYGWLFSLGIMVLAWQLGSDFFSLGHHSQNLHLSHHLTHPHYPAVCLRTNEWLR